MANKEFTKYFQSDQKFFKDQDIIFGSDSKITFEIDKNKKIKNLKLKSNLNFDNVKIDYISNRIKKRIPNFRNQIFLNSDYLELDYSKNKTQIKAKGKYSLNDKFDDYEINIINEKNKFNFESSIDLNNIPIVNSRDNIILKYGLQIETWHHTNGCRLWLIVERCTKTHKIFSVKPAHPKIEKLLNQENNS